MAEHEEAQLAAAEALMKARHFAEAIDLFEGHVRTYPDDLRALLKLGICHLLNRGERAFLAIYEHARILVERSRDLPQDVARLWKSYKGLVSKVTATALILGAGTVVGCGDSSSALKDGGGAQNPPTEVQQQNPQATPGAGKEEPKPQVAPDNGTGKLQDQFSGHKYSGGVYMEHILTLPEKTAPVEKRGRASGELRGLAEAISEAGAVAPFKSGNAYYDKGDYDHAIQDYAKAIELKPDFAEAYFNRGLAYNNKGDYDRAIPDFTKTIKLEPDHAEAYNSRGIAYDHKGDQDRALKDYTKAIELNPDYAKAYNNRGIAYYNKADYDRAILDYTKAIELKPDYAGAYCNRGEAYYGKTDYNRAILEYTKAIEVKPDLVEAYFNRGLAYSGKGDYNRAIQDHTKAIELKPDFALAYFNRGIAYLDKGDYDPDPVGFRSNDDYDRAVRDLNRAIELKPDDAYARVWLFLAKERLGQDGKIALAEWRKGLKDGEWMTQIVRMCVGEITPEQCLAAASDKDPRRDKEKKCQGYYYVGRYYLLSGHYDDARARDSFRQCVATGVTNFMEYASAQAALKPRDQYSGHKYSGGVYRTPKQTPPEQTAPVENKGK